MNFINPLNIDIVELYSQLVDRQDIQENSIQNEALHGPIVINYQVPGSDFKPLMKLVVFLARGMATSN